MPETTITTPNRKARRAERAAKRPLFASEIERLKDMPAYCPWSYASLARYARAGLLKTRKIAGSRCVHRDDWKEFIAGTPCDTSDISDLVEEAA